MAYISTHNLSVGYSTKTATNAVLSGLNIEFEKGTLVSLLGANGAGKSTLLRTLTAVQPPLEGSIMVGDAPLETLTQRQRSRLIGIVTTDRIMAGALTVRELVSLGRQPYTGFLGRLDDNDKDIVQQAMQDAGIAHKAACYVSELSDGERQKAMIAKSLAQHTPIIILDEPTAFLDVASRFETMSLLHDLAHKHNKAVLLSSHDITLSLLLSDQLWIIGNDKSFTVGQTESLILSGALDTMFSSSALQFNKTIGDFEMMLHTERAVRLDCADAALSRAITCALMRNAIAVSHSATTVVTALLAANGGYSITALGKTTDSIENLIKTLKTDKSWT